MKARRKIIGTAGVLLIAIAAIGALSSGCDNRNPINPSQSRIKQVAELSINFNPPVLTFSELLVLDTVDVMIFASDEDGNGVDSLDISLSRYPSYGIITTVQETETKGLYSAQYITSLQDTAGYTVSFQARVGGVSNTVQYPVRFTSNISVAQVAMNFNPSSVVVASPEEIDTALIELWVRDDDGIGLDSVRVQLLRSPNIGTLVQPAYTENGYAQAKYITEPTDTSYAINFTALAGGVSISRSLNVYYSPINVVSQVSVNFDPPTLIIRSPYRSDTALINIWVRDASGAGIHGMPVQISRSPNVGTIVPPPPTDSGFTQAKYITDPGVYEDVTITVTAGGVSVINTLDVISQLLGEIGAMNISLEKISLIAGGDDSARIYVSVSDTANIPIGDNTTIFISNYGPTPHRGTLSSNSAPTLNGVATFVIRSPLALDTALVTEFDSLKAWGISLSGETTYARAAIGFIPGTASTLQIITLPTDMVAGSGASQPILALARDANGNNVINGTQINFRRQLTASNITALAMTNRGVAQAIYTVGTTAGTDFIRAFIPRGNDTLWSQTVPLTVRSAVGSNITLTASDPTIEIGGIATQIIATLRDENNNPLSEGYPVQFQITSAPAVTGPEAPSFNYVPTADSIQWLVIDSTDVSGRASVALYSGTYAGTVRIKATAVDNPNVFKEKVVVVIESGPPANIIISSVGNVHPEGEVYVGGVTALVLDAFTNPVEYNTAVHFQVVPDSVAMIGGNAFTGGIVFDPDSGTVETVGVPGLAFTQISYTCTRAFRQIRIVAQSGALFDTSSYIVLPIYAEGGRIAVGADPGSIWITVPGRYDTSEISAQLIDGIGCAISEGIINFAAQVAGELCGPSVDTTDLSGWAYTKFRISYEMIPQTPPNPPQVTAKVTAVLRGYPNVKGEATIDCRRP